MRRKIINLDEERSVIDEYDIWRTIYYDLYWKCENCDIILTYNRKEGYEDECPECHLPMNYPMSFEEYLEFTKK